MTLSKKISFLTPGKINLFLFIQEKRNDGYHELLMDMVPISLFDRIELVPNDGYGFQLVCNQEKIPIGENIITKAVDLLKINCKRDFSLKLNLTKNIPSGAGLGGGSGNAAGVLVCFNQIFDLGLSKEKLKELALQLGADVPFFIDPKPVQVRGVGELMSSLPFFESLPILLFYPGFQISTTEAYRDCQISKRQKGFWNYRLDQYSKHHYLLNDFWEPLSHKFPKLQEGIKQLQTSGALITGMSGSGSTLYGVYDSLSSRDEAINKLNLTNGISVFPVETLNSYRYYSISKSYSYID
ncbi:MAG: 4-(cytidine 5'-diphospho)-2-C-methyl-D-erythritol kinase [Proteobacteria bacterium]|nr:4-(cytidine 5'-diphospho)-2-C-methyl-D-erythritol kinase [Pseudomonadota bacterium]